MRGHSLSLLFESTSGRSSSPSTQHQSAQRSPRALCAGFTHDERGDLDRQVARLSEWAAKAAHPVVSVEAEVISGMNGSRSKMGRMLCDPKGSVVLSSTGTGWLG
jgi:predicted site-specific integrase-resolvase